MSVAKSSAWASILAVSRRMRLSWDQIDGIMQRAVRRGLARRKLEGIRHVGVDETSFQRRHTACGFRNRERFRNAIYFHFGKLDLYPARLRTTHTTS